VQQVLGLLQDEARRQQMHSAALAFTAAHRGASQRIVQLLQAHLPA
jgi:3-deoxy-D-manno-octulosonic-acid transferase